MVTRKFESNGKNTGNRNEYYKDNNVPSNRLGCIIGVIAVVLIVAVIVNFDKIMTLLGG